MSYMNVTLHQLFLVITPVKDVRMMNNYAQTKDDG